MFGRRSLLNGIVSLAICGFATGVVGESPSETKAVEIYYYPLAHDIFHMSVVRDDHKKLRVDGSVLSEVVSSALEKRYVERIKILKFNFRRTPMTMVQDGLWLYWHGGIYYRLGDDDIDIEYVKMPVKLNLEINGFIMKSVDCQWEVSFRAGERWENISVNTMRISSCRHPDIDFTSNVFIDILSHRLDDVFVYPDTKTRRERQTGPQKRFTF